MPYNTTAIPPSKEPTGTTQLPFSRIRRIVLVDNDINVLANQGAFVITLATEMFIQYLAEQAHNVVKSERKPRRNIQYRDLSSAVSRLDNLEFLQDIVPKTVPFKEVKEKKPPTISNPTTNGEGSLAMEAGQTTLDGSKPPAAAAATNGTNPTNGFTTPRVVPVPTDEGDGDGDEGGNPDEQLRMENRRANARGRLSGGSTASGFTDAREESGDGDVEMKE